MQTIDIEKFKATPAVKQPFEFVVVERFVKDAAFKGINDDYPTIDKAGNFPLESTTYGKKFEALVKDLRSAEFQAVVATKFGMKLEELEQVFTIRAHSHTTDGNIHTDAPAKAITALIYMNPDWEASGGRLRLLHNEHDIENYITEVPPTAGTLLLFKRADNSWHGHKRFVGPRRTVQINWVTDKAAASKQYRPMTLLRRIKKLAGLEA